MKYSRTILHSRRHCPILKPRSKLSRASLDAPMKWEIVLEKRSKNKLNAGSLREKLREMVEVATRNKSLGFSGKLGKLKEPDLVFDDEESCEKYLYNTTISLGKSGGVDRRVAERHFQHVFGILQKEAIKAGWSVWDHATYKDERGARIDELEQHTPRSAFRIPELTDEVFSTFFKGVYEREAHIRLLHDAARTSIESLQRNAENPILPIQRSHVLLKGLPAGCKTTLFERFKTWYESNDDTERVMFVDGPTLSKAGLENLLLELAGGGNLPEFMVIEEIEKQDLNNLLTLLSVMGSGYVAKLNARVGHVRSVANVVVWATCNDESIIQRFRNGALWSRFTHKLHCARPTRELMHKILVERINEMDDGNPAWADSIIEFAFKTMPEHFEVVLDDPREIIGLLDGRDRLLDGSYQSDLMAVLLSELREKKRHHIDNERQPPIIDGVDSGMSPSLVLGYEKNRLRSESPGVHPGMAVESNGQ